MAFARPDLIAVALLLASPATAARRPPPPPLPPLVLPAAAPLLEAEIAGLRAPLTVDFGGEDIIQINPESPIVAALAQPDRGDGEVVSRGTYRVAVGQTSVAIPFSRETASIAGRRIAVRVLTPAAAPAGQPAGSAGTIGLPLLPHDDITLVWRAARADDIRITVPARQGRSDALGFDWPLGDEGRIDAELHPQRPTSVASAAAASRLASAGDGRLRGPVQRVVISFGAVRPVRRLELARPLAIAGLVVTGADVRLLDWAGRTQLPPDADADTVATVVGRRGRQGQWANLKLGSDVLRACASIRFLRTPPRFILTCPAGD
jgi:hypothetical protein